MPGRFGQAGPEAAPRGGGGGPARCGPVWPWLAVNERGKARGNGARGWRGPRAPVPGLAWCCRFGRPGGAVEGREVEEGPAPERRLSHAVGRHLRPGPGPPPRAGASPAPPGPPGGGPKKVTPPTADPLALFQFSTENRRTTFRQDARFLTRQGCSTLQKTRMSISVISTKCSYRARRAAVLDGKSEKMPRAK